MSAPRLPWKSLIVWLALLLALSGLTAAYAVYLAPALPWEFSAYILVLTGSLVVISAVGLYFAVFSGKFRKTEAARYSVEEYGADIREADGPITWLLLLTYGLLAVWWVYYLVDRLLRGLEYGRLGG